MNPIVTAFMHDRTGSLTYVVQEPDGPRCAVVDPVLDYDNGASQTSTASIDPVIVCIRKHGLTCDWILETHAHADRLSAAQDVKARCGGRIGIGEHIVQVQQIWKRILNLGNEFMANGSQFDHLFKEGDRFRIGALKGYVLYTPGHTQADVTYLIGDAAFIGDTLFMTDYGSARADFPGGDARALYRSIQKLYALPPRTRLFLCHDYLAEKRQTHRWETTVAEQQEHNIQINATTSEEAYVEFRNARDKQLATPKLLFPSLEINMRAGQFPPPESNGRSYLKVPITRADYPVRDGRGGVSIERSLTKTAAPATMAAPK
ncbi:MAG: MBL fold metallo-hydrolase [Gammaproteobacteria bacterium]